MQTCVDVTAAQEMHQQSNLEVVNAYTPFCDATTQQNASALCDGLTDERVCGVPCWMRVDPM